jgi:hypothetical protein
MYGPMGIPPIMTSYQRRLGCFVDGFVVAPVIRYEQNQPGPWVTSPWVRAGREVPASPRLAFGYYRKMETMSTKKVLPKRKRGRPATGRDPVSAIRLSPALRSAIESWAKQQPDKPSRSEAIRQLVEFALKAKAKRQSSHGDK